VLFASSELVARIERAECELIRAGTRAAARRAGDDVLVNPIAGGLATFAVAGSPLNKVAGLGFDGVPAEAQLEDLERELARRGAPVQVELASLADPAVGELLSRRGYVLVGVENVLARPVAADPPRTAPGIELSEIGPTELEAWIDVTVTGFMTPDTQGVQSHESFPRQIIEDAVGDIVRAEGHRCWIARRGGVAAGAASMRSCERVAQLCGASTLPEHRRNGVQSALLATRLVAAAAAGCDVAVITTQPGSTSCQNAMKQGFELLYVRNVLVREP
jgi:hypothetical protein